jgi:hypothetical protein
MTRNVLEADRDDTTGRSMLFCTNVTYGNLHRVGMAEAVIEPSYLKLRLRVLQCSFVH